MHNKIRYYSIGRCLEVSGLWLTSYNILTYCIMVFCIDYKLSLCSFTFNTLISIHQEYFAQEYLKYCLTSPYFNVLRILVWVLNGFRLTSVAICRSYFAVNPTKGGLSSSVYPNNEHNSIELYYIYNSHH